MYNLDSAAAPVAAAKQRVSTIGKLFLAVFFIVLFEGAIRKWVSTSLTNPLVIMRDGLALYGVYWALNRNKIKSSSLIFKTLLIWTTVVVLWGILQLIVNQNSPFLYIIGLRFWLLYLWFGCATAVSITENDFRVIIKTIMLVTLCMMPLIVLQFYSPPGAFINKQLDDDADKVFRLAGDVVRTTGLFSFTAGQSTLLATVTPFVLSALMGSIQPFRYKFFPVVIFIALAVCTMLSGSRSALATFIILFITMVTIEVFFNTEKNSVKKFLILTSSLILIITVPIIFSAALDATTERVVLANESESLSGRLQSIFFGEPTSHEAINFIGHGIGMGTNYAGIISNTQFALGETEAARILLEGGIVGFIFIALKIIIIITALKKSFYIIKKYNNTLPLLLWITLTLSLLSWSIIGQLTINALGYLFLGLGIASIRLSKTSLKSPR